MGCHSWALREEIRFNISAQSSVFDKVGYCKGDNSILIRKEVREVFWYSAGAKL